MMELHGLSLGFIIFVSSWLFCKAGVQPKDRLQTAEIGKEGRVIYDVHDRYQPDPNHLCPDFDCRTPHGPCNNTDKYQVVSFSEPTNTGLGYEYECGIRIQGVSESDAGVYMICRKDSSLNRCLGNNMNVTLSVWRKDIHGRICTTTVDNATRKRSSNCTLLTTTETPTTTDVATTTPEKNTVQITESEGDGSKNDAVIGKPTPTQPDDWNRLLCQKKILIAVVVVVFSMSIIFAIGVVIRRRYRRSCRGRRNDYELGVRVPNGNASLAKPSSNGQAIQGDSEDNDSE
ncbi:uncharacterized protein LOC121405921 isoform X2 [Lytechinus variegatus]|uniref:uncharacterized protein LOC121405921 isoform X2 n=1 Tax=Lytechinus variegatus TaxID=7654 RepID=UPI001BB0EF66|nr:uncharacterized protein LOC121405921 isoform X2 [Lytechinus variegatus]